ncbi:MAG: hypothetical protein ABFS18_02240 [Thermodesulfobacteriota bacterium]
MARKKVRKGKLKSGTWIEREMTMSRAYLSLSGFAPQLLTLFLLKRDIDSKYVCQNLTNINMTYAELENIFNNGMQNKGLPKDGITRPRIIRALDDLMAKGFVELIRRGGMYKQDKSVYALREDWRWWLEGRVVFKREKDTRERGYRKVKLPSQICQKV